MILFKQKKSEVINIKGIQFNSGDIVKIKSKSLPTRNWIKALVSHLNDEGLVVHITPGLVLSDVIRLHNNGIFPLDDIESIQLHQSRMSSLAKLENGKFSFGQKISTTYENVDWEEISIVFHLLGTIGTHLFGWCEKKQNYALLPSHNITT